MEHTGSTEHSLFDAEAFGSTPITVIGVGGIGSWVALRLAEAGVKNLHIRDGDVVEPHNSRNQFYFKRGCIGKPKVEVLSKLIRAKTGVVVTAHNEFVTPKTKLGGIVFLCVDSNDIRKEIMDGCVNGNPDTMLVIDLRMDASMTMMYTVDLSEETHLAMWYHYWVPHSGVQNQTLACGSPIAVSPTASRVADDGSWQLFRWFARKQGNMVPMSNFEWYDLWKGLGGKESW